MAAERSRAEQVRDIIMFLILALWLTFGAFAVVQLFTSGAKVLESLPPFWFWGVPIAPYTAMYAPWRQILPGGGSPPAGGGPAPPPVGPVPPPVPQPPEATP